MNPSFMFEGNLRYRYITFENSLAQVDSRHVAHCSIYSPNPFPITEENVCKAFILMQVRFDGSLGFPGGVIKEGVDIVSGLNRELCEEINLDSKFFVTDKDYLFSHEYIKSKQYFHFYAKKVTVEEFKSIEKDVFNASDYGRETLGLLRIPLFTMKDGFRGFPAFLSNRFAGNAKDQLLSFLLHSKLMSREEIKEAEKKSENK